MRTPVACSVCLRSLANSRPPKPYHRARLKWVNGVAQDCWTFQRPPQALPPFVPLGELYTNRPENLHDIIYPLTSTSRSVMKGMGGARISKSYVHTSRTFESARRVQVSLPPTVPLGEVAPRNPARYAIPWSVTSSLTKSLVRQSCSS